MTDDARDEPRVSLRFFVAASKALVREHGERDLTQAGLNALIRRLGEAEAVYRNLSRAKNPATRRRKESPRDP